MPRPQNCKNVECCLQTRFYKPAGQPLCKSEIITLTFDELEAMRLKNLKKLYQQEAARRMGVSRQTLANILRSAYRKISDALVNGKALSIEGGVIAFVASRRRAKEEK